MNVVAVAKGAQVIVAALGATEANPSDSRLGAAITDDVRVLDSWKGKRRSVN